MRETDGAMEILPLSVRMDRECYTILILEYDAVIPFAVIREDWERRQLPGFNISEIATVQTEQEKRRRVCVRYRE